MELLREVKIGVDSIDRVEVTGSNPVTPTKLIKKKVRVKYLKKRLNNLYTKLFFKVEIF